MPRLRSYRVVHPPSEFELKQDPDGWWVVLRNGQPIKSPSHSVAARFEHHHVALGFLLMCELLEKRFR